jgi:hypothetical protein
MKQHGDAAYARPKIVDYGDLQELTASCAGGTGGDSLYPAEPFPGFTIGASNAAGACKSKP